MGRTMDRWPMAVACALLVTISALMYPQPARAADGDMLDQSQPAQNTWGTIGSGGGVGEVFTAARSGYLTRVSLYLGQYAADPAFPTIVVTIQTVTNDGLPSGTQIGEGSIPAENLPPSGDWVDVDIDGAFVTAGTRYALLAFTAEGVAVWYMGTGDVKPYPSGYWVNNAAGVWEKILTNQDWAFKTYVAPDALDQDQSQTAGTGGGTRALGTTPVGQAFTVGVHGLLDRVRLYLANSTASPGPIMVTIVKATSTGLPNIGTQVASGTIVPAAIPEPGYRAWVTAAISPFAVDPGTQYVLLLSTSVSGPQWVLVSDVYPGGTAVIKNGTSWTAASYDFAFQTYVLPPVLDQSQTRFGHDAYSLIFGIAAGQYFTAHVSGMLDRVSVVLDKGVECTPPCDIAVAIADDLGTATGTATIPSSSVPNWYNGSTPPWIPASFTAVSVRAGRQYLLTLTEVPEYGGIDWYYSSNYYPGGEAVMYGRSAPGYDMAFKTYVLPVPGNPSTTGPGTSPCVNGVCPAASGGFTPADLTDGVTSHFRFQERPDGTVKGILSFNDPRPDGPELHACTTESAACALTVTRFACTGPHSLTVVGRYKPRGGTDMYYGLTLSEGPEGTGTFMLVTGDYTFTLTLDGITHVTCPELPTR